MLNNTPIGKVEFQNAVSQYADVLDLRSEGIFIKTIGTDAQKAKIEQTAQAILDARALYPDCSLADLYDEVAMPPELRKAHQQNDRAVMEAYGMPIKGTTEATCVAELMRRYQELTQTAKKD